MNVYLLFALAFGAVTGVAEVRIAPSRPEAASVRVGSVRSGSAQILSEAKDPLRLTGGGSFASLRIWSPEKASALTGAATPRAPAQNC